VKRFVTAPSTSPRKDRGMPEMRDLGSRHPDLSRKRAPASRVDAALRRPTGLKGLRKVRTPCWYDSRLPENWAEPAKKVLRRCHVLAST
jgi:hypothetical protein